MHSGKGFLRILLPCMMLKELRNRVLLNILVWSLFCLIRVSVGLHFLQFHLENWFFVFLCFVFLFCFESNVLNQDIKICYNTIQFCHVLCLLCNFARTLCIMQKQAFILSYSKKLIYKGRMSNSQKIKECKKRYHKIS